MKERPLKIVIFDGSLKATTFINRLAKGLTERHKVYIIGFDRPLKNPISNITYISLGSGNAPFRLILRSMAISLQLLFKKGAILTFLNTFKNCLLLKKGKLKQQNFEHTLTLISPDILHLQWPSLLPYIIPLADTTKMKMVLSQRGYQNNVRPFVDKANRKLLEELYPKIDGFHSVSKAISQNGDLIYSHANKIDEVVYSGFDFELLPFSETFQKNEIVQLVSIGRPHWKKGYTDAVRALKRLDEQGVAFHYQIIGAANSEELQYLIAELALKDHIELRDKIPQEEVYELMQTSDLFLLPSIEEGLPNVMIEAMAIGLPVIATHCGGVSELLDNECGMMVPTRNPEALAMAIRAYLELPTETLLVQRKRARAKVLERHSTERMIQNMEALYHKCLESSHD